MPPSEPRVCGVCLRPRECVRCAGCNVFNQNVCTNVHRGYTLARLINTLKLWRAVALVFDRLSPESRLRARDAALSYLGESVKKNELVGVFLTDLSVSVFQPFTYDTQLIKAGIEKVGVSAPSLSTSNNERTRAQRNEVTIGLFRASQEPGPPRSGTEFNAPIAQVALNMLEYLEEALP
ncbi:MAG TPA: hypothetical protein VFS77_20730 [Pyrinomonadaceae bacterium]|nr:hypothetical protein [Pyrinomonadaceae bacterium]